jgi:DNA-binding response OmpR family regulator
MVKKKILVVDDDESIRTLIRTIFEERNYNVFVAQDAQDAIATARNQSPHLILVDVMLPHVDGFSLCKELKNFPMTRHIPIIFVTVKDKIQDRLSGFQVGADDYITKPFSPLELVARVEAVLNRTFHYLDETTGLPFRDLLEEELIKAMDSQKAFSIFGFRFGIDRDAQSEKNNLFDFSSLQKERIEFFRVQLATIITKVLCKDGDFYDSLGVYDGVTILAITFSNQAPLLFDRIIKIWKNFQSMEQNKFETRDSIELAMVHLEIKNTRISVTELFDRLEKFFDSAFQNDELIAFGSL